MKKLILTGLCVILNCTWAIGQTGGGVSHGPVAVVSGGGGGIPANLVPTNVLAYVIPSQDTYYINGQSYYVPNSTTAGIQECLNRLTLAANYYSPAGGAVVIRGGLGQIGTTIMWPPTSAYSNAAPLALIGEGQCASVLLWTNVVPADMFKLGTTTNVNSTTLVISDIGFASLTNATTNIVEVGCANGASGLGGVGFAIIENCTFAWWYSWTNWCANGGLTPDVGNNNSPACNLIGLMVNNSFGDQIIVTHNHFDFCMSSYANDHGEFSDNMAEGQQNSPTAWPVTSPYYLGACFNFVEPVSKTGVELPNGNNSFTIIGNHNVCYTPSFLFWDTYKQFTINEGDFETPGDNVVCTVPNNIVLVNPNNIASTVFKFYNITNESDLSKPLQLDTGLVQIASVNLGLNLLKFNATNANNVFGGTFIGNGVGLTNLVGLLNASAAAVSLGNNKTNGMFFYTSNDVSFANNGAVSGGFTNNGFWASNVVSVGTSGNVLISNNVAQVAWGFISISNNLVVQSNLSANIVTSGIGNWVSSGFNNNFYYSGSSLVASFSPSIINFIPKIQVVGIVTTGTHTPAAVTLTGSPFTFQNLSGANMECNIAGGTAYTVTKNGATIFNSLVGGISPTLQTNCILVITYTIAPSLMTNSD